MKINQYANHDPDDPMEHLDAIEAALLATRLPQCPHCHEEREMVPMPGSGWGVGHIHEPDCPEHEDNQPTLLVDADEYLRQHDQQARPDETD